MYKVQAPLPEMTPAPVDQTTDQKLRRMVIKHRNQFLLLDLAGGMRAQNGAGLGLYVNDTRFLSQWELSLGGEPLQFLSADAEEGFAATITYSNRALEGVPEGAIGVSRQIVVDEKEIVADTFRLRNFLRQPLKFTARLAFAADFADMFEVRGSVRIERGWLLPVRKSGAGRAITLRYLGVDNILRRTKISFPGLKPVELTAGQAAFEIELAPQQTLVLDSRIQTAQSDSSSLAPALRAAAQKALGSRQVQNHGRRFDFARLYTGDPLARARRAFDRWSLGNAQTSTAHDGFNRLLERSNRDLYLLSQETSEGSVPVAGLPWFAVPFGRDSLVAGLQTLVFMPEMSKGILKFLAAYQGKKHDEETCEKPGRIMHELRPGEMAGLAEIPFRPYFGTADATQLWLMLYARYVERTGDLEFARQYWPTARKALNYLARECKNGYVYYGGTGALTNQGWKDSGNCIVYASGELAKAPIAVCEVQAYLYAAWREVAALAVKLGNKQTAGRLEKQAAALKERFNLDFWMPTHNTCAIAMDGEGRQCDVVSSNAGHLLGTGILPPNREKLVAERLMQDDMFSGWGLRTLSSQAAAYHPSDYQVGSVWPHDNGIIAVGMYQAGEAEKAHRVVRAMLDTALSQSDLRLPELFAGFSRAQEKQPVPYQVACVPQLWAAGCALHMVSGMLGLRYEAGTNTVHVTKPNVPDWLAQVHVDNLRIGDGGLDLSFRRQFSGATTVEVRRVSGNIRCLVEY